MNKLFNLDQMSKAQMLNLKGGKAQPFEKYGCSCTCGLPHTNEAAYQEYDRNWVNGEG